VMNRHRRGALDLYAFPHLEAVGARHAVSTRLGGVSEGAFATLNLGYSVGDDPLCVEENRRTLFAAMGIRADAVVSCHQVHSTSVTCVDAGAAGRGAATTANIIPASDALITNRADLYLFLRFADCVPVLLCDPMHHAVGLAHAGWKGTIGNIVGQTVAAMSAAFATRPLDLLAAIAPCIGSCHYQIREDVAQHVRAALPFWPQVLRPDTDEHFFLDLAEANRRLLVAAGVAAANIVVSGLCTACHTDQFYSHRAENGKTGRFGVLLAWTGDGGI